MFKTFYQNWISDTEFCASASTEICHRCAVTIYKQTYLADNLKNCPFSQLNPRYSPNGGILITFDEVSSSCLSIKDGLSKANRNVQMYILL